MPHPILEPRTVGTLTYSLRPHNHLVYWNFWWEMERWPTNLLHKQSSNLFLVEYKPNSRGADIVLLTMFNNFALYVQIIKPIPNRCILYTRYFDSNLYYWRIKAIYKLHHNNRTRDHYCSLLPYIHTEFKKYWKSYP